MKRVEERLQSSTKVSIYNTFWNGFQKTILYDNEVSDSFNHMTKYTIMYSQTENDLFQCQKETTAFRASLCLQGVTSTYITSNYTSSVIIKTYVMTIYYTDNK